jgi:aspartoacylase
MNRINKVALVGATHGNEFTGAYLIKKYEQYPHLIQRDGFETLTLFANPKAFEVGRRYIDKDLNRCFKIQDLENPTLSSYEDIRAKDINQILGPKGKSQVDVILDLHSTTANMGLTILLGNLLHPFNLQLAVHLSLIYPEVKVGWAPLVESRSLKSICELGFVIEVGPVAQGVLNAELFQKTEKLVDTILDYLEAYNQGSISQRNSTITLYEYVKDIDYPRNDLGEIQAMIHPQLQFRDYEPLNPGDPMFITFDGKEIVYEGESTVSPIFINEAAYYEKGIAMCITEKRQVTV